MELNKIYNESNLVTMSKMQNDFIDCTITSPPYDNLREYNGYSFDF
jgi:site-specific DNA-methyltransferase (adenine-specific)